MDKLKFIIKHALFLLLGTIFIPAINAQQNPVADSLEVKKEKLSQQEETANTKMGLKTQKATGKNLDSLPKKMVSVDSTLLNMVKDTVPFERFKIDGVAAVVGDRLILESDIRKMYKDLKSQGISTEGITDCKLAERLMKNKLYAHHAIQDSLVVDDERIMSSTEQQIDYFVRQIGSMQRLLEFYNLESEAELRNELFEINKERQLAKKMQDKIIEEVEITPEEVREFFDAIPKEERPRFGDEVEIAQIVIKPEVSETQVQKAIDRLNEFRDEILAGESTFATKAVLYSDDPGSSTKGGKMTITRDSRVVQEFKDVAFSLQEGKISKPFKTEFGYHILKVDKIRGQQLDIRHILIIPEVTNEAIKKARAKIDSVRQLVLDGEVKFSKAARKFSDQKETRGDGGKLINPVTGDTKFEQTKVDPSIYNQVVDLKEDEVSNVLTDTDRLGNLFFKIITVTERYPAHIANYAQDYAKIKELALKEKKLDAIAEWQEEKIKETYIKINGNYRDCVFKANWQKNEAG